MKAKIKGTGEIVEVKQKGTVHISCPAYHTTDNRIIPSFALEFEKNIDWEKRRYEIAKEAMQGILSNESIVIMLNDKSNEYYSMAKDIGKAAVTYADSLIAELKKGGEQ